MNNNIELFPARIASRIVEASEMEKGSSMVGGYSPDSDSVVIPASDTAYARTVRMHEAGHAIWSRNEKLDVRDYISQAVEDVKIHGLLQTTDSVRRDELYAAISDLRAIERKIKKASPDRALQGINLLRAASILRKSETSELGVSKFIGIAQQYHPQGRELCDSIIAEVAAGNIEEAKTLTSFLFNGLEAEQKSENEQEKDVADWESYTPISFDLGRPKMRFKIGPPTLRALSLIPLPSTILVGNLNDYIPQPVKAAEKEVQIEASRRDPEDGTIITIVIEEEINTRLPNPVMYAHTLSPNASRRVHGRGRNVWKSTQQGIKIRNNRLALNSIAPWSNMRLFEARHLGGTVLIDASGSMELKDQNLYEIAEKFPAGKVAYYSGAEDTYIPFDLEHGCTTEKEHLEMYWTGHLIVYAQHGKIRKDHGEKLPKRAAGNLVDYYAILWLLKQPAPRYMMTDVGFTGPLVYHAKGLLNTAIVSGKIKVFHSMSDLMAAVKKRG